MKKIVTITTLFIMIVMLLGVVVNAVTASSLVDDLYALGKKYGVNEADKVKAERYLADNPITDAQAQAIYAKAEEAVKLLDSAGVTDGKKLEEQLTKEQRDQLEKIAQEAADIIGVTLTYKNGTVEAYKDGKKLDVFTFDGKAAYTGNNTNITLVVASSVAVIALVAVAFVVRKKFVNA